MLPKFKRRKFGLWPNLVYDKERQVLPPLIWLRAVEASARHLSFTLAAEELNLTQAAISQQIRKFEARLGAPLFHRAPPIAFDGKIDAGRGTRGTRTAGAKGLSLATNPLDHSAWRA
jgi:hypothetical protein